MALAFKNINEGSENEILFGAILDHLKIPYKFEPETIDLIPSLKGTMGLYKPTQYTPDFLFELNGEKIIIETKGFMRGRDALIIKFADYTYTKKGYKYFCITQAGSVKDKTLNYFIYSNKGIPKRGAITKTFFETIGLNITNEDVLRIRQNVKSQRKELTKKAD